VIVVALLILLLAVVLGVAVSPLFLAFLIVAGILFAVASR